MRFIALGTLLLARAVSVARGAEQKEAAVTKREKEGVCQRASQPACGVPQHHHAFVDPDEKAKKWNAPERDKWQRPEEIVAALALERGAVVADIGAGTGYMVAHLSNAVGKDGTIVAIDSSPEIINYLTTRKAALEPATIVPWKVEGNDPGLLREAVDAALTLDTWHHLEERVAYAEKVYRGLKPGGRFVVVEYNLDAETGPPTTMRVCPEVVRTELESAGFRVEFAEESMPLHYMVVGHKDYEEGQAPQKNRSDDARPSPESIRRFFADPSERAKRWNDPERDAWQRPEEIITALDLQPGMTVADIGAGTGYMLVRLSQAVGKHGTVIAIDTSAEMVQYLNERRADGKLARSSQGKLAQVIRSCPRGG